MINARIPVRFRGRIGDQAKPEDIQETIVPITINRLWGQDMQISDQDLTLTIDRFGERYIEPAVQIIANMIDGEGLDLYQDIYNLAQSSTPGVTPTTRTPYLSAGVQLSNSGAPMGNGKNKALVISPEMEASMADTQATLFNPPATISKQYEDGTMGYALGWKWNMDQNVARQVVGALGTAGAIASAPLVNGANQTGTSLNTKGWDYNIVGILKQSDIIRIAGVNAVLPIGYRDVGQTRTFVLTQDASSDGGGLATLQISPPINNDTTDPFQTVVNLPADGAVISVYNTLAASFSTIAGVSTPQALGFMKDCFTLAVVPLELPGGMDWSERVSNPRVGLSVRLVRGFDIQNNRRLTRLDVLGGWKTTRPELGCRVPG